MPVQHKRIEAHSLPLETREDLCRSLLAEFGATSVHVRRDDHELNVRCVLPWHPEKGASASLNWEKLTYRCHGCNSKGGLLWLIGTCRGESSTQAKSWLREQSGQGPDGYALSRLVDILDTIYAPKGGDGASAPMPRMSMQVLQPWYAIHPYMTEIRKVPVENIKALRIGYGTFNIRVGEDDAGKGIFQSSERIVFPHIWRGDLVGWQTRRLISDGTAKYLNSADFPKDRTLYDFDPARRTAVIVESPMSVARHRHHQPLEGTFGAACPDQQVRLMAQHPRVVLWFDNDDGGWKAIEGTDDIYMGGARKGQVKEHHPGIVEKLLAYSDVRIVVNPYNADPADMDDETVDRLIAEAVPPAVWKRPARLLCWTCKGHHEGKCTQDAA